MENRKISIQLTLVLLVLTAGIIGIFWILFPIVGKTFVEPGSEYNQYYVPFTLWSIGASLPLLYSIYHLFKVVLNINNNRFFDQENVTRLYACYRLIFRTDIVCCFLMCFAIYININPGILIMCALLAIVGFIVAQFFKILAIWVERGTELKEELELII